MVEVVEGRRREEIVWTIPVTLLRAYFDPFPLRPLLHNSRYGSTPTTNHHTPHPNPSGTTLLLSIESKSPGLRRFDREKDYTRSRWKCIRRRRRRLRRRHTTTRSQNGKRTVEQAKQPTAVQATQARFSVFFWYVCFLCRVLRFLHFILSSTTRVTTTACGIDAESVRNTERGKESE